MCYRKIALTPFSAQEAAVGDVDDGAVDDRRRVETTRISCSTRSGCARFRKSVSIGPGATAFTWMPCGPRYDAKLRVKLTTPALVTPYQRSVCALYAATEARLMIRPDLRATICFDRARISSTGASRFTASMRRRASSV